MRIIVNDANILIDLVKLNLLPQFFALRWECHTTSLIFEELYDEQQLEFAPYQGRGLLVVADLTENELTEIAEFQVIRPEISEQDCSALFYTIKISGILLTSDRKLREYAEKLEIEVHGHLWLIDEMIRQNCISAVHAAEKLTELVERVNPKLNLPRREVSSRIHKWNKSK